MHLILFAGLLNFGAPIYVHAGAEENSPPPEWELPPIVAEGQPFDLLNEDFAVPASSSEIRHPEGSGGIQRGLLRETPLTVTDLGSPGSASSILGLGRSSEETNVTALGIPLNPAQGGGFDLSTFPQFLWADREFRLGPAVGPSDARATAGTLKLMPWTDQALYSLGSGIQLTQLYSGAGVIQLSVAAKAEDRVAAIAGFSDGEMRGPSVGLSGRWGRGRLQGKYHFLGSRLEVDSSGPASLPTPGATQLTSRWIPVAQADWAFSSDQILKTSIFYDGQYVRYEDPNSGTVTGDQVRQGGLQASFLTGLWRFGLGLRRADYHSAAFSAPTETVLTGVAARTWVWGRWSLEPSIQGTAVTALGAHPGASVGVRRDLEEPPVEVATSNLFQWFARGSFSKRFPSLLDRFARYSGYIGNPALKPERDWTLLTGLDFRRGDLETTLELYSQLKQEASQLVGTSPQPIGSARVFGVHHRARFEPVPSLTVSNGLMLAHSRVLATGRNFSYLPAVTDVIQIELEILKSDPEGVANVGIRTAGKRQAPSGRDLPGYALMDAGARVTLRKTLELSLRLENLLDRRIELVEDFPISGRTLVVSALGQF